MLVTTLQAQPGVSINASGLPAAPSAMLDVSATDKGVLVPRLSSAQRLAMASPATGLLVFDTNTAGFWFFNGAGWQNLSVAGLSFPEHIQDADANTKVMTEKNPNEDKVRVDLGGVERFVLRANTAGLAMLEPYNSQGNTFYGYSAGNSTGNGNNNTFMGYLAGTANTLGNFNTFYGGFAGTSNTTGEQNTFLGLNSGRLNTTGYRNTFTGTEAGFNNSTGFQNAFFGTSAGLYTTTGSYNTFVGGESGKNNTTGSDNTFVGNNAGVNNTANFNTFMGSFAGFSTTTGASNTFIGLNTGRLNTSGSNNTFLGAGSGYGNTTGVSNVFIGTEAGYTNSGGTDNTLVGRNAGRANATGAFNTYVGSFSGFENITGMANTCLGVNAGRNATTGSNNVYIGNLAGANANQQSGSSNIFIGYNAGNGELANAGNKLVIENSSAGRTGALIYGEFDNDRVRINNKLGIGRDATTNSLEVNGDYCAKSLAGSWLANSDARLKKNVVYLDQAAEQSLNKLLQLRGVTYEWDDDKTGMYRPAGIHLGFIAQDIQKVFPEKVSTDKQGYLQTAYGDYDPLFVESFRVLDARTQQLAQDKESLKQANADLQQQLQHQQEALNSVQQELQAIKALLVKAVKN